MKPFQKHGQRNRIHFPKLQAKIYKSLDRHEQATRLGSEGFEAIALIECLDIVILGINNDCIHSNRQARMDNPANCVEQQKFAQPDSLIGAADSEPSDQSRRNRVVWQLFCQFIRQPVLFETHRAQSVVPSDLSRRVSGSNKNLCHTPPYVLRGSMSQIVVKCRFPAGEGYAIVLTPERLDTDRQFIHRCV